jgi:alkanesulfonate monooxygenase SsuD/methylene tetrahydromethanopterin reductase-like flavin-dependent oxidoreductase (luciferase family)
MVGTPDEIVAQLRQMEKDGLKELNLLPAADHQKEVWKDFAEKIFPAFR